MRERDLYAPIVESANNAGWHIFRLEDGAPGKLPCDIAGVSKSGLGVFLECKIWEKRPVRADINRPVLSAYAPHQLVWTHRYAEANAIALLVEYDISRHELCVFMMTQPEHFEKDSLLRASYPTVFRSALNHVEWAAIERVRALSPSWHLLGNVIAHRESLQDKPALLRRLNE